MSSSPSSSLSSSSSDASGSPPPSSYATSASSPCTTPEPIDDLKPNHTPTFTIPPLDDPRDYTIPSLAWQYTRIASALEHLNCTAPTVIEEFRSLASELASRAASIHPSESRHIPIMPIQPEHPKISYITALARYKMRVAPRAALAAWKEDEEAMGRVLGWYRLVARAALADAGVDEGEGCCCSDADEVSSPQGRKRSLEEDATSNTQSATSFVSGKRRRTRVHTADANAPPRRSSRKSVAPRRFGAFA